MLGQLFCRSCRSGTQQFGFNAFPFFAHDLVIEQSLDHSFSSFQLELVSKMLGFIIATERLWSSWHALQELLEWQLRVRSEQNWATQMDDVGLRLAELATYRHLR